MKVKLFPKGSLIVHSEQAVSALHIITKGSVCASYVGGEFHLQTGDVIGVSELSNNSHFISYTAMEDTSLASYACTEEYLTGLLCANPDFSNLILNSLFRQFRDIFGQYEMNRADCINSYQHLMKSYSKYVDFCSGHNMSVRSLPGLESLTELSLEEDVEGWLGKYYGQLQVIVKEIPSKSQAVDFILGMIYKASKDIFHILSIDHELYEYKAEIVKFIMNENRLDLFDLYMNLLSKIGANDSDSHFVISTIDTMTEQLKDQSTIDKKMYKDRIDEYKMKLNLLEGHAENADSESSEFDMTEITDSLNTILVYAECDDETAKAFRTSIDQYYHLSDKNSSDDDVRRLRQTITKQFHQVYTKAFLKSLSETNIPRVIRMFFNFGYVDEKLAGMENAAYLYSIVDYIPSDPSRNVYTIYEWLKAVYEGRKAPSRNEFDNDYPAYVHELRVTGQIRPADEAAMLADQKQQVLFELDNMLQSVNKVTFGRISIYCPVFSEGNVLKDLPDSLVSADKIEESINRIRSVDFSAFYRETMYSNQQAGIVRESVDVEILPDVILMPNIGIRGVMWQEIEGRKRTTPSRMMLSIFQMENLDNIFVRLTGEFRWEMCRRIQSVRWNDVSEPSLTSEYFDYIQFYKKNRDLSADAKEKIKQTLQKARNSFKEMFIRDYESWVIYEGAGSPRLNKVARSILFTYCPFSKDVRSALKANPLYKEMMDRYEIKLSQKKTHINNLFKKLQFKGIEVPEELHAQCRFLDM